LCAPDVDTKPTEPSNLAYLLDAPHPHFEKAEGLQRGRKLQTLMFRDKRGLRQECIEVCHETSHEHGKPEQMDAASADAFGAVVRVAGLAVRDGLARSLLLARNTGAAFAY
jgi:hypothetical protein